MSYQVIPANAYCGTGGRWFEPTQLYQSAPQVLLLQQVIGQPDHFARSSIQRAMQMPIRMAALNHSTIGATKSRKAIPKDVRAEYKRLYGVGHEAILVVPAGTSKAQAKALHGQWLAEVETRIERIRAATKGAGQPLTKLNALALAGRWYLWFVARHEGDPGPPEHWEDRKAHSTERVWYPHAPVEHLEDPNADLSWPWTQWPEVREAVRPEVAEMA